MRIACLGDSLTEGDYGIKGKSGIANVHDKNYPYFLSLLMQCEVKNFGKCGARSSYILQCYSEGLFDVTDCDIVLIMLGTNGGQSAEGDSDENRAYEQLLNRISQDAPMAKIMLITPPNASMNKEYSNNGYMPQVEQAQGFTRRMAQKYGLELIDISQSVYLRPEYEYIFQNADGLHFTLMGYYKLAEQVYQAIRKYRTAPLSTIKLGSNIPLVAHRGLSGIECENSAASFIAAANRGYYGIETDVWRTADGKFVCCHDPNTGRIANKALDIENSPFDELRALKYTDYDRKTYSAELCMPTPEEYIRICKKYGKHCIFELKSSFSSSEIAQLVQLFKDADYLEHVTFISTSLENLRLVRSYAPDASCQMLHGFWDVDENWVERVTAELTANRMDLDMDWFCITKDAVAKLHENGIKVNCWTVDNPELAQYLVECGVDYITTNILENK